MDQCRCRPACALFVYDIDRQLTEGKQDMRQIARGLLIAAVAAATGFVGAPPASAQLVSPFGREATTGMSREDLTIMRKAMRDALDEYTVGATRAWSSPKSGKAGKATVTKIFEQGGMKCAQLAHEFTQGTGNNYTAPLCKVKDGSWKLAF
jgi:surface antigen